MIKRIPVSALRVGMFISDLNNDWIPHNNNRRRGVIRREELIARIAGLGVDYVYIDTDKGLDAPDAEPAQNVDRANERLLQEVGALAPYTQARTALEEEMVAARRVHSEAEGLVGNLMQDVKLGKAIDLAPVQELAEALQGSVFRNPNAMACLGRIREKDNYLLEHSVNLSVLMSIFGKAMQLSPQVMTETVVGALLHDIGKILIPDNILHKPGRLNPGEFEIMKQHAVHSHTLLASIEGIGELTLLTAAQHHERVDGGGYPAGLKGEEISIYGRMVAIADVYDAITANRVYHEGLTPTQGLKKLMEWSGSHLDPELVRQFIRCIGIYPVGSTVLLESGRLGVVVETNADDQRLPVVRLFYHTKFRMPVTLETLDLAAPGNQDRIVQAVDPAAYKLDIRRVLA
ncbi:MULTISPECIES: HD-GYP domain-containing protein [Marinobacter]|uniref:HD-GYP domain-containing protein n=1 Tax=Marinobacter TaxID=2742 RepID=UPI000DAD0688|nr:MULTISPECIES: HD-GYP domain-containing protein [Marinobacter]